MKMTTEHAPSQLIGLQSNNFQLTNSAKIIDIVINKMYTNKPGAVIRELSANAWDAHCEADNKETPFEIHLPTWLSREFMIRDYGIGIPHDKFEAIYTNIGGSTKDTSDDLIGGFGLGSKTPFTMVDSFTVENWRDGLKSTWLCFKDQGNPRVTMLAKEPSSEPTGVKVSFVFEEDEVLEFTEQLTKQLKYFPTKPLITGGVSVSPWDELPDGWETKDYFYSKNTGAYSWNKTHTVVMGNVSYELNPDLLNQSHRSLFNESLALKVPIGSVDIPPSRENLEYTAKTKEYLNKMLVTIRKEYNSDFLKSVKDTKSYLGLRKLFSQANSSLVDVREFKYKGKEYVWGELSKSYLTPLEVPVSIKSIQRRYANVYRQDIIKMTDVCTGLVLYINDLGQGSRRHINEEYSGIPDNAYIVCPPTGTKKTRNALLAEALKETKDFFGMDPILLSSITGFPVAKGAGTRAKADQIFELTACGSTVKSSVSVVTEVPTEGYMLPMKGWDAEGEFKGQLKDVARFVGDLDAKVYLVRKASRKDVVGLREGSDLQASLNALLVPKLSKELNFTYLGSLLNTSQMRYLRVLDWKGVDNLLHLVISLNKRLTHDTQMSHRDFQAANRLVTEKPKSDAFVSQRAKGLIEVYNTRYKGLITSLTCGWQSQENIKQLHTFLTTQENT